MPARRHLTWTIAAALLVVVAAADPALAVDTPKPRTIYRDGPSGRFLVGGKWYDRPDPLDAGVAAGYQRTASIAGWDTTTIPNAANAGDFSATSYMGSVHWYRKDFRTPRAPRGSKWILRFESVNYRATVWLNGKPLGTHVGSYLPFELPVKSIKRRGVNRLVVRADSRRHSYDIPPLSQHASGAFEGGWWNYTGILREVYLRRVTDLDMSEVFVQPRLRCRTCAAKLTVEARVTNLTRHRRTVRVVGRFGGRALRFRGGVVAGRRSRRFTAKLRVARPRLWSPEHPTLYTTRLAVLERGRSVQRYTVHSGIRSLRVNRLGRIELNGREVNLRGASVHEDHPTLGAALGPAQLRENMNWLRRLGATMTRAHYPLHPYFLELADRYGIVVWSEVPVYRMSSHLFDLSGVRRKGLRMLREAILRDRNHPSIMVWSVGNENASRPEAGLKRYIRDAAKQARSLDPTRLVGIATSGYPSVEKQRIYLQLDAIGINDYFGWYSGPRGTISDRSVLPGYLDRMHSDYPHQALVITEFGAEADHSGPVTDKGTYEFQTDFLKYHLNVFDKRPFINAALIWNLRDFRVRPGWNGGNPNPKPPLNQKGLVDDADHEKPSFAAVRSIFRKTHPQR